MVPIATGLLFFVISYGAIKGIKPPPPGTISPIDYFRISEVVPWIFQKFGYQTFANFREKDVSIKSSDFYKIETREKQIESVKGANLKGRSLEYADMFNAFLMNADLRGANLRGANLRKANLQGADLRGTNLSECDDLNIDQFYSACGNFDTITPPGILIPDCEPTRY